MLNIPKTPLPKPSSSQAHTGHTTCHKAVGFTYIQGLSEHLQRLFRKQNISIYHRPWNTIPQSVVHPKDKVDIVRRCDVIYQINCPECESCYVGETSRSFGQRFKEHTKITGNLSAIGEHCAKTRHKMELDHCKILDTAEGFHSHKTKAALYIKEMISNLT